MTDQIKYLLLVISLTNSPSLNAWALAKQHDNITIYTRDVPQSSLKAFRAVTTVDSTLTAIVALLEDTEAAPNWLYSCQKLQRLKTLTSTRVYNYSINDLPWPVKDRDAIIYSELRQDPLTLAVHISMKGISSYLPEVEDYVRIPNLQGEWIITPLKSHQMKVSYKAHIEPGGNIPDWLVNSLLVETPLKTFQQMKKLLPDSKYQLATRDYIQIP